MVSLGDCRNKSLDEMSIFDLRIEQKRIKNLIQNEEIDLQKDEGYRLFLRLCDINHILILNDLKKKNL